MNGSFPSFRFSLIAVWQKKNAIATSDDVIRGKYNAGLVPKEDFSIREIARS